jgi:hypothetical protein
VKGGEIADFGFRKVGLKGKRKAKAARGQEYEGCVGGWGKG